MPQAHAVPPGTRYPAPLLLPCITRGHPSRSLHPTPTLSGLSSVVIDRLSLPMHSPRSSSVGEHLTYSSHVPPPCSMPPLSPPSDTGGRSTLCILPPDSTLINAMRTPTLPQVEQRGRAPFIMLSRAATAEDAAALEQQQFDEQLAAVHDAAGFAAVFDLMRHSGKPSGGYMVEGLGFRGLEGLGAWGSLPGLLQQGCHTRVRGRSCCCRKESQPCHDHPFSLSLLDS